MKILFLILLVLMNTVSSYAKPKAFFKEKDFFFQNPIVVIDEKEYSYQFLRPRFEIAEAMKTNPSAYASAKDYDAHMNKKDLFLWGGLAAAVTYMIGSRGNYNSDIYWGLIGVGFGIGMYHQYEGNKDLNKAITIYNTSF